ncbi:Wzz/FepE/Etk N-terminal domain-containing protein [Arcobacter arenosus]|uniref:Uncharacterized protein n=1 Tax=Arcobacter arenosus TaxID=2576037 RepID=A0A5R8Y131_9BACT|nr:Wzz/FepE/Etk N-terminal domain-containing protein [Arcobacter arenosus]TLP37793.1 hypothetical protein FDK22_10810 [Arcobacter arenosus]
MTGINLNDEIDLRDLLKIIWDKRKFIIVFTFVVTVLAIVYAMSKKPIYEVKSVVRVGYLNDTLVEDSNILEKKLRLIFGVDTKTNGIEKDKAIVSNISTVKKVENFLEISTQAFSNELAIMKNKEVVNFLQNEYKYKIDEFILRTNINIKNLEEKIAHIEKVEKVNIEKNIEKIKTQSIPKIDKKIELIKTQSIPKIDKKIELIKTQSIPKIDKKIELIKNVEIKSIEHKLEFNTNKLNEYQVNLLKISKQKSSDNTQNMLMAMQILNTQNLILDVQNIIENLRKERENLLNIDIKELEVKRENLLNIDIKELEIKRKNLLNIDVKDLELQKENYKNDNIRKLEIDLNINIPKKIEDLKNSINLEKLKLTNSSVKNSEIVGDIQINDYPIKPKKKSIVIVAFVTGFILSIFLVFFIQFIKSFKKEDDNEKT